MSFQSSRDVITGMLIAIIVIAMEKELSRLGYSFGFTSIILIIISLFYIVWDYIEYKKGLDASGRKSE